MKSYKILSVVAFAAFFISACGEGSSVSNAPEKLSNADMEVNTYKELPSCVEKRDGKTGYVVDQDQGYICRNGEWVEKEVAVINKNIKYGSLKDSRDGRTYKTVVIGSQTWMAENLNYKTDNSYCYKDSTKNCDEYGRLYTWSAAMDSAGKWTSNGKGCGFVKTCSPTYPVRGVCPPNWHLPTKEEFETLFSTVGGESVAGKMLKSISGWDDGRGKNGIDAYGFSVLPAGFRYDDGHYQERFYYADFWSSTESGDFGAYIIDFDDESDRVRLFNYEDACCDQSSMEKNEGFSIRCVKD